MEIAAIAARAPVIPVLTIERVSDAVPVARALAKGGLPVLEITLRTEAALEALRLIAAEVRDAIVGAGTVLNSGQLEQARRAGAQFAVSPGCTPALAQAVTSSGMPFLPGVQTVSEAMALTEQGFRLLKFFPADTSGGVGWLKAVAAPLVGLRFCPTGGVTAETAPAYLALGNVACVGGSWVAPKDAVAAGDWTRIERLAAAAAALKRPERRRPESAFLHQGLGVAVNSMNRLTTGVLVVGLGWSLAAQAESVLVLNSEETSFSIIDRATRTEIGRQPLGREPHHVAVTPDGKEVLLASTVTNDLVALDTTTGEPRRIVHDIVDPYQLGFSPDGKWFVTVANRLDHIDIYRGGDLKLVSRIFVESVPSHLVFDPESKIVFVSLQKTNRVVAYDLVTQALKWNVEVGKTPAGLLALPDGKRLLVALTGEDGMQVLDPKDGTVSSFLQTGKGAHNFWPKGDGRHWFLSNRVDSTVSLIDTKDMKVVGTIVVPGGPDCMAITADGKEMWITQRFLRRVAVIDLAQMKIVASIQVGKSPHGVFILKGDAAVAPPPPVVRAAATETPTR